MLEELQDGFFTFWLRAISTRVIIPLSPCPFTTVSHSSYKLDCNGSQESSTAIKTEPSPGPALYNLIAVLLRRLWCSLTFPTSLRGSGVSAVHKTFHEVVLAMATLF